MEMADYLGDKGVPVALVVPFDGTQSFPVPGNVARVINFTQRDYAYMRPGPGFRGSLNNVDLSSNHIGHLNIDKSPELHARVLSEVLAVLGRKPMPSASIKSGSDRVHSRNGSEVPVAAPPLPKAKSSIPRCPLSGVKRTSRFERLMSAFDPKRTSANRRESPVGRRPGRRNS
jgi:hypothetical protein